MKTLRDYVKGYGFVPILLLASHTAKDGTRYELVKEESYPVYYFMKGEEVVKKEYIQGDKLQKLSIDHINHPRDITVIEEILEQPSYNSFVKFVYDKCGEEYHL